MASIKLCFYLPIFKRKAKTKKKKKAPSILLPSLAVLLRFLKDFFIPGLSLGLENIAQHGSYLLSVYYVPDT